MRTLSTRIRWNQGIRKVTYALVIIGPRALLRGLHWDVKFRLFCLFAPTLNSQWVTAVLWKYPFETLVRRRYRKLRLTRFQSVGPSPGVSQQVWWPE